MNAMQQRAAERRAQRGGSSNAVLYSQQQQQQHDVENAEAGVRDPPSGTVAAGVGAVADAPRSAAQLWRTAGRKVRAVQAFDDRTGQRPSDANEDEWLYRDWPVWQCGAPIFDRAPPPFPPPALPAKYTDVTTALAAVARAKRRARRMVALYLTVMLPATVVIGIAAYCMPPSPCPGPCTLPVRGSRARPRACASRGVRAAAAAAHMRSGMSEVFLMP
jgi:hypothetical protein